MCYKNNLKIHAELVFLCPICKDMLKKNKYFRTIFTITASSKTHTPDIPPFKMCTCYMITLTVMMFSLQWLVISFHIR